MRSSSCCPTVACSRAPRRRWRPPPGDSTAASWRARIAAVPGLAPLLDLAYRAIASHRPAATRVTRLLWGNTVERPSYATASGALPSPARPLLPRGVRLVLGPGRRPRRRERNPPGRRSPSVGPREDRRRTLLAASHAVLARPGKRRTARDLCRGRRGLGRAARGNPAEPRRRGRLALLAVRLRLRTDLPGVPVGPAPARGGPPRRLPRLAAPRPAPSRRRAAAARAIPPRVAALPPDASLGSGQARQRRSGVAGPVGASLPLLDAAASAVDRVVRALAAGLAAYPVVRRDARGRARRAAALLRARPAAAARRDGDDRAADRDRADRKLRVLQPADRVARGPPARRRRLSAALARTRPPCAACAPDRAAGRAPCSCRSPC